jgi:hypothetical protein
MRIVTFIDEADVIERILRHLGLWEAGVRVDAARDPPSWSSNPGSTRLRATHRQAIRSPTTTTNRCLWKTDNADSSKVRPGGSHFRPTARRVIDSQSLLCQHSSMEIIASSFKLRAIASEGRKHFLSAELFPRIHSIC